MLFEFRVYAKNVVWPTHYGIVADDFNSADELLRLKLKEDGRDDWWTLERIEFINS